MDFKPRRPAVDRILEEQDLFKVTKRRRRFLGLEVLEDDFSTTSNTNQIGRTEDFFMGARFSASVGWADESFGADRDALIVSATVNLGFGSLVGAVFAAVTFSASAFSLPMIMHRDVDSVTAIVTSINAVLRNKWTMAVWLTIIVVALLIGIATAFVGLIVIVPVIGYAAWHGYLETIDASAFPRHAVGITALPRHTDGEDQSPVNSSAQ